MFIFDIETGGLSRAELKELEPEFEAGGNVKDPIKVKLAIEKKRAEWYNKAALSPITGEILAIGIFDSATDKTSIITGEEKDILEEFWLLVSNTHNLRSELVGWNSNSFDIPFLIKRSWKHSVSVPRVLTQSKWLPKECVDLLEMWMVNGGDRISLDRVCKFLGLKGKNGDGAMFSIMLEEEPEKAIAYLKNDIEITTEVAVRFGVL